MHILLLWPVALVALWVSAYAVLANSGAQRGRAILIPIVLAALPPTVIFLFSSLVLLLASSGSYWAQDLWAQYLWVTWWQFICRSALLVVLCYVLWFIGSFTTRTRASIRVMVIVALVLSVLETAVIYIAFPTA